MNIAIVDDRQAETDALKGLLSEYAVRDGLVFNFDEYTGGEAFLENYEAFRYTVIFLDIFMGGMTGIDVAEQLKHTDPDTPIVFLTTSSDHMGAALSIHAYDYIRKPVEKKRLFGMMDDLLRRQTELHAKTLTFSSDKVDFVLPLADIVSIGTDGTNYLTITDKTGTEHRTRRTFSGVCEELADENRFLSVTRGLLVNMDYISRLTDTECILRGGATYPLFTKKKGKDVKEKWKNYVLNRARDGQDEKLREEGL